MQQTLRNPMLQNPHKLDLTAAVVTVAGWVMSPEVAEIIGPYALIVIFGLSGGLLSRSKDKDDDAEHPLLEGFFYYMRTAFLALVFTVAVAKFVAWKLGTQDFVWLLPPTAFAIGYIGDDWSSVFRWLGKTIKTLIEYWAKGAGK